jgi:hypothetical protein
MLSISVEFSLLYGHHLAFFIALQDAEPFDPRKADLGYSLDGAAETIEEDARDAREFSLIRPWLELLISCSSSDVRNFGIPGVHRLSDAIAPLPGAGGMPDDNWEFVLEYIRQRIFKLDAAMTSLEKVRAKADLALSNETLEEFRARMRREGRLPDPE